MMLVEDGFLLAVAPLTAVPYFTPIAGPAGFGQGAKSRQRRNRAKGAWIAFVPAALHWWGSGRGMARVPCACLVHGLVEGQVPGRSLGRQAVTRPYRQRVSARFGQGEREKRDV